MPVQTRHLEVVGVITPAFVPESHGQQGNKTADNVSEVKARDTEERGSKKRRSPWIAEQTHAFIDKPQPFANVQEGEDGSQRGSHHRPHECGPSVGSLCCPHTKQHGEAACEQDESHCHYIHNAMKWTWPGGCPIANKAVGHETRRKGSRVSDDEQPDCHLFCRNSKRWQSDSQPWNNMSFHCQVRLAH